MKFSQLFEYMSISHGLTSNYFVHVIFLKFFSIVFSSFSLSFFKLHFLRFAFLLRFSGFCRTPSYVYNNYCKYSCQYIHMCVSFHFNVTVTVGTCLKGYHIHIYIISYTYDTHIQVFINYLWSIFSIFEIHFSASDLKLEFQFFRVDTPVDDVWLNKCDRKPQWRDLTT